MSPETAANILAVMVSYGTTPAKSTTLQSLAAALCEAKTVLDLLIYDNSPEESVCDPTAFAGYLRITYHHNPANAGISTAINVGARMAREMGKQWLLLLDQDTAFPSEAILVYLDTIRSGGITLVAPQLVAGGILLSPCGYRAGIGYHLQAASPGVMQLRGRSLLNSGLLVQLDAFEKAGCYDEQVRVDFADFAFINRFRRHYQEVVVLNLVCRHGFSNLESVPMEAALGRFSGYCRDGRAAAVTPLLQFTHAFLVLRRCLVLTVRYRSFRFLPALKNYFSPGPRTIF